MAPLGNDPIVGPPVLANGPLAAKPSPVNENRGQRAKGPGGAEEQESG